MAPILTRRLPQPGTANHPTMTNTTQGPTSQVLEFNCIYTHDILRKNQKRWHDGRLSFHTFNKRVMVYDLSRNSIGDTYAREFDALNDGDEIRLDRPVLVQVCEAIGTKTQDLTGVIGTRDNASPSETVRAPAFKPTIMPENAAAPSLRQVLGASKRVGRAHLLKSAYDQRQETLAQQNAAIADTERPVETPRPAKRQRKNESQPASSSLTPGRSPVPLAGGRPPLRVIKQAREVQRAAAERDYCSTKHTYTGPDQNHIDPTSILISSSPEDGIASLTPVENAHVSEPRRVPTMKAKSSQHQVKKVEDAASESQKRKAKLKIGANTSKKRMMFGDLLAEATSKEARRREASPQIALSEVPAEVNPPNEMTSNAVDYEASHDVFVPEAEDVKDMLDATNLVDPEREQTPRPSTPEEAEILVEDPRWENVAEQHTAVEDAVQPKQPKQFPNVDQEIDTDGWETFSQIASQNELENRNQASQSYEAEEEKEMEVELPAIQVESKIKPSSPRSQSQTPEKSNLVQEETKILVPSTPPSQPLQRLSLTEIHEPQISPAIQELEIEDHAATVRQEPIEQLTEPPLLEPSEPADPPVPLASEAHEVAALARPKAPSKKPYRKKPLLNREPPIPAPAPNIPSSSPGYFETQLSPNTRRRQRKAKSSSPPAAPTTDPVPTKALTARTLTKKSKVVSLLKNSKPKPPTAKSKKGKEGNGKDVEVKYTFRPAASGLGAWSETEAWDLFGWMVGTARCVAETARLNSA